MRPEFQVTFLNARGEGVAVVISQAFSVLLDQLETCGVTARELALVKTKLEEARFFALEVDLDESGEPVQSRGEVTVIDDETLDSVRGQLRAVMSVHPCPVKAAEKIEHLLMVYADAIRSSRDPLVEVLTEFCDAMVLARGRRVSKGFAEYVRCMREAATGLAAKHKTKIRRAELADIVLEVAGMLHELGAEFEDA